ncbi:MAG: hypothetical protein EAX86_01270 [Candidatus Heimdallarchaeota archaeon]|nr:hypothetical protein [Candidatus Heimdallarchaeota archaeon]
MRMTWKIKKLLNIERDDYVTTLSSLPQIADLTSQILGFQAKLEVRNGVIISQISHCQYWEGIKKA